MPMRKLMPRKTFKSPEERFDYTLERLIGTHEAFGEREARQRTLWLLVYAFRHNIPLPAGITIDGEEIFNVPGVAVPAEAKAEPAPTTNLLDELQGRA